MFERDEDLKFYRSENGKVVEIYDTRVYPLYYVLKVNGLTIRYSNEIEPLKIRAENILDHAKSLSK